MSKVIVPHRLEDSLLLTAKADIDVKHHQQQPQHHHSSDKNSWKWSESSMKTHQRKCPPIEYKIAQRLHRHRFHRHRPPFWWIDISVLIMLFSLMDAPPFKIGNRVYFFIMSYNRDNKVMLRGLVQVVQLQQQKRRFTKHFCQGNRANASRISSHYLNVTPDYSPIPKEHPVKFLKISINPWGSALDGTCIGISTQSCLAWLFDPHPDQILLRPFNDFSNASEYWRL